MFFIVIQFYLKKQQQQQKNSQCYQKEINHKDQSKTKWKRIKTMAKIKKTKTWFFEKINKQNK